MVVLMGDASRRLYLILSPNRRLRTRGAAGLALGYDILMSLRRVRQESVLCIYQLPFLLHYARYGEAPVGSWLVLPKPFIMKLLN
jgi:hypothetical protein